jgi:hypothetical protein
MLFVFYKRILMQDIQTKAITTYQNNLNYFQETHPEIYKKIDLLSQALEQGSYKENYSLEYKDDYFDILDTRTNEYLYGSSSIELAQEAAKKVNYTKTDAVIETFYNYNFSKEAVEFANEADPTYSKFVLTAPVVQFSRDLIDKKTSLMKEIYKFIFFGVGLGLHISEIHKKVSPYMSLIIEDNLEIFRLSLFVTDYAELGKSKELYFSIMENKDKFKETFNKFYHNSFIRNNYMKYSLFYDSYKIKIASVQEFIVTQSNLTYQEHLVLKKSILVLKSLKENYKFFDVSKHHSNTPLSQKPLILVAAGPSLGKNIEWLQKNAPYVRVAALFMTLPILEKHNIKADIVFHVDENMDIIDKTIARLENKEFVKDSLFFLAPSIDISHFLTLTKKENIYLFEDRTRYRFNKGFLEAFSIGEVAYALSLLWDTKELYLLGLDLALDSETKATHADGHASSKSTNASNLTKVEESDSVSLRGSELTIKGNFRELVSTTPLFDMSRIRLNHFTKNYKNADQKVYNLNDGAYFVDTIAKEPKEIDFTTKEKKDLLQVQSFFDAHASATPDEEELLALHERKKDAEEKRDSIVEFSKKKSPSLEQMHNSFTLMAAKLIVSEGNYSHELSQIYVIYLENVGGYIGDFFNTSGIKNPKRSIKQFQKIITLQLLKIVDKYLESLEEF